jgi:hypothetical protein
MKKSLKYFVVFFGLATTYLCADVNDPSTGVVFPSEISFDANGQKYNLKETGVSTRKKFFVKVYSVASYIQDGATKNDLLEDGKAKQLTMKWVHEADAQKIQDGYKESFKTTLSSAENTQLTNEINKFVSFFSKPAQKGDEYILRWIPGGTVQVILNGTEAGTITNPEFAKGLWSIWFGTKSVVDKEKLSADLK